jgi:ABC-type branched-subunit amino acid transport system ATPase component
MSDSTVLRVDAVEKCFGGVRAIDGLSLEIGCRHERPGSVTLRS